MVTEDNLNKCRQEISKIKQSCIGLFKYHTPSNGGYELVMAEHGVTIDTIGFNQFGAVNETYHLPFLRYGEYRKFPDGKNMEEMLQDPLEWNSFIKSFN